LRNNWILISIIGVTCRYICLWDAGPNKARTPVNISILYKPVLSSLDGDGAMLQEICLQLFIRSVWPSKGRHDSVE
jgi:hypothetical protein